MHDRARLAADLRALGLAAGDTVMVHASVRAVGEIAGGPDEIHLAIKDVVTPAGTLVMYASCPRYVDEIGRGNLSPALEAELLEKLPPFDPETAQATPARIPTGPTASSRASSMRIWRTRPTAAVSSATRRATSCARATCSTSRSA